MKITRIVFWYLIVTFSILIDEYFKEGYLFRINDLFKPATHENLIMIITIAFLLFIFTIKKLRDS